MNANTQDTGGGVLDTIKMLIALGVLVGGIYAYYYYAEISLPLRVLMVLGATALGVVIAMSTARGRALWTFIQGSRVEIRKIVWPTKQESTQTTIAVFIFTVLMGLFFWGLDTLLLLVTGILTGQSSQ